MEEGNVHLERLLIRRTPRMYYKYMLQGNVQHLQAGVVALNLDVAGFDLYLGRTY